MCWNKIICIKSHLNASVNDSASTGAHQPVQIFNLFQELTGTNEWANMERLFGQSHSLIFIMALTQYVSTYFHCTLTEKPGLCTGVTQGSRIVSRALLGC